MSGLLFVICLIRLAISVDVADGVEAAMPFGSFSQLSPQDQLVVVEAALRDRIEQTENLDLQILETYGTYEFQNGELGRKISDLNGKRYRYRRIGRSYRADWELGDIRVASPNEWGESAYDAELGLVTSTYRGPAIPGQVHGRIDSEHNSFTSRLRYLYFLNGENAPQDPANYLFSDALRQRAAWQLTLDATTETVALKFPWVPPWDSLPRGQRTLNLSPEWGFLPVSGTADLSQEVQGKVIWRAESLAVDAVKIVGGVCLPARVTEVVRASSSGGTPWNCQATVIKMELLQCSSGTVVRGDFEVVLPEGAYVNDAVEGIAYTVGRNGAKLNIIRHGDLPPARPKLPLPALRRWLLYANAAGVLVLVCVWQWRRRRRQATPTPNS